MRVQVEASDVQLPTGLGPGNLWVDPRSALPSRAFNPPPPIMTENGVEEQEVETILDHQRRGRGFRFLVHWKGFPSSHDSWLPGSECRDLAALDDYLLLNPDLCTHFPAAP